MKQAVLVLGFFCLLASAARAQTRPMWRGELPGGSYSVALASINSVSTHQYVVDRAVNVYELTVDTNGAVVARMYYVEPVKASAPGGYGQSVLDRAQEKVTEGIQRLTDQGGDPMLTGVVKNYPLTTHAHTVEYRLQSRDDVDKIFKSIEDAWRQNKDTTYKPAQ